MNRSLSILLVVSVVAGLMGCNRAARNESQDIDFRFTRGQERFENNRYYRAIDDFNFVVLNSPADARADDAQLYLADSYYEMNNFLIAASEYRRLVQRYPESPLTEQARYKLGLCLVELSPHYQLEQDYTTQAINTLQRFIEDFPTSQYREQVTNLIDELRAKLAHKLYSNAHLYFIQRRYESSLIYHEQLLSNYYDTMWANQSRLERARALLELERPEEARTQLEDLLQRDIDSELRNEARRVLQQIQPEQSAVSQAEG